MRKNSLGFTLVELLVVIAVLGILMGIVVAVLNPATILNRSKHGALKENVARVCHAVNGCYTAMGATADPAGSCDTPAEVGIDLPADVTITANTAVVVGSNAGCTYNCAPDSGVITVAAGTCYAP